MFIPWPNRKKVCSKTTCTPELTSPFSKYSLALGKWPEANHSASTKNASQRLVHWKKKGQNNIFSIKMPHKG